MPDQGMKQKFPRLPSLTGIRFIAAISVFMFHWSIPDPVINLFGSPGVRDVYDKIFSDSGWFGVSFFFVLSGFVMTWTAKPSDTATRFWRRRAAKVYPNHIVTWALCMALFAGATATPVQAVSNLFLVHTWIPKYDIYLSINQPSWSLCSEVLFYLLFPFILPLINRIREGRLWAYAGGVVAGGFAVPLFAMWVFPSTPQVQFGAPISVLQYWFTYAFPVPRLLDFVLGMLMARIVLSGKWIPFGLLPASLLILGGYVLALNTPFIWGLNAINLAPMGLFVAAAATADIEGKRSWVRGRAMVWLGDVSFAFYMVQSLVMLWLRPKVLGTRTFATPQALGLLAVVFAVTMVLAWALHKFVEMPMMRFSRPRGTRRPAPVLTPTASSTPAIAGAVPDAMPAIQAE
jgi:peptidoglycan/LPS O-acetylase OafA/YrhL